MTNQMQPQRVPFSALINTEKYKRLISKSISNPQKAERFVASIISAVSVNPALQECTIETIISGALLGESLNLSPSPQLGQYYLVPFKQKEKKDRFGNVIQPECTVATFVPGYRGILQLALRSGQYKKLNVVSVKDGELKKWDQVTEDYEIEAILDDDEREKAKTIGYLAFFEYVNGFRKAIYWSHSKMLSHADRYSAAFSKDAQRFKVRGEWKTKVSYDDYVSGNFPPDDAWMYSSFWYKDFDSMAHKTMLKQLISKWGIMSIDLQTAFEADTTAEKEEYFEAQNEPPVTVNIIPAADMQEDTEESQEPAQDDKQVSLYDICGEPCQREQTQQSAFSNI